MVRWGGRRGAVGAWEGRGEIQGGRVVAGGGCEARWGGELMVCEAGLGGMS